MSISSALICPVLLRLYVPVAPVPTMILLLSPVVVMVPPDCVTVPLPSSPTVRLPVREMDPAERL